MDSKIIKIYRERTTKHDPIFGNVNIQNLSEDQKDKKDLKGKYCNKPFTSIEVDPNGSVHTCCVAHMPYPVGNIFYENLKDIWINDKIRLIRESILNGSYNYCMHTICPMIVNDVLTDVKETDIKTHLPIPIEIAINLDTSCNLSCPSCRSHKIDFNSDEEMQKKFDAGIESIVNFIFSVPRNENIIIKTNGAGDAFYSKSTREFLLNFDPTPWPNLQLEIVTHGVLFTEKYWNKMSKWHNKIKNICITVDAATKETYDKLRPGGDWDILLANLLMLTSKIKENNSDTLMILYFIVQKGNYNEMVNFIDLFNSIFYDIPEKNVKLCFNLIMDWGSFDNFDEHAVWKPTHPEFDQFNNLRGYIKDKADKDKHWGRFIGFALGDAL
jgi:MoaA/NifB/PqqE/SkfB family radical SAM enzyme